MTHVVHPFSHRLGIIRGWKSRWFSSGKKSEYIEYLKIDTLVRNFVSKKLKKFYVSSIELERGKEEYKIIIKTSRSGMIIGRGGEGVTVLQEEVKSLLRKNKLPLPEHIKIEIEDIRSPDSDAGVVASQIMESLEKRLPFRRVLKMTAEKTMANRDVYGVKILISGRLGGADMARKEYIKKGRIPLQTIRANIDYRSEKVVLPYGVIGIKVWIYRGEVFEKK